MSGYREPKAILFDLDDTIVAWDAVTDQVWAEVCHNYAPRVSGLEANKLFNEIKRANEWYYSDPERLRWGRTNLYTSRREVVSLALSHLGISDPDFATRIADSYSEEKEKTAFILPGVIDTLKYLINRSIRLVLASNGTSEIQHRKIERLGLASFFDFILIEGDFGIGKPDERFFWHILNQLNIYPSEAWMVGDRLDQDIGGAQRVGIYSVWVDWKAEGLPESTSVQPDRIIKTLSELL